MQDKERATYLYDLSQYLLREIEKQTDESSREKLIKWFNAIQLEVKIYE